ncbi:MAG: serine O-acetyltransferase [Anaerolineae bacterium]|jgi:serine O-acetyltransferase|nr:serine O-acetyltransferase [Anaerolineae bacterium]
MLGRIREDVAAVLERDPAAFGRWQVLLFYPGLHALWAHRLAHRLWRRGWRLAAHAVAALARFGTGIEIHPAARIGRRLFIDHGMGVVIGETAEIGDDVTLYHGVTLGGVSLAHGKRHPTLEDHVVVGAGAKILGAITIGRHSRIGANSVVVKDVAPEKVVVGIPGKVVTRAGPAETVDLRHDQLPDVVLERLEYLLARLNRLEDQLQPQQQEYDVQPDYSI